MEAKIYKKNESDTNVDIINRLELLLEEGIDNEVYYERFNDVYKLTFNYEEFIEFLRAKKAKLQTYGVSSDIRPINIYTYDNELPIDKEIIVDYYNDYDIAYYDDNDIDKSMIYRINELLFLVESGKVVLYKSRFREEVMDDDMFIDEVNDITTFSEYPFSDYKSLDSKTKELTMRMIHTIVPVQRINNDINLLSQKVKKIGKR